MTDLILLRHGETVGQSSIRLYGATDIALSPIGEQQVSRAAAVLEHLRFTRVLSSPLQRARRSAEIVLAALTGAPPLEVVPDFREIDFGAWEGWTYAEAQSRDPSGYARWLTEGHAFTYPGGESRSGFLARIAAAARSAIDPTRGPTLAVLHKGVIKATLSALLGRPPAELADHTVPLASLHRLRHSDNHWQLLGPGETHHLGDLDLGG
jgi:broad specificity phosphatase PhoE